MFLLEIDFQLRTEKRREFNSSLESLLCGTGSGYARASAYEDRDDGNRLLLVLEWNNRDEIEAYLDSPNFGALLGCLRTLGQVSDCRAVDLSSPSGRAGAREDPRWVRGQEAAPEKNRQIPTGP